MDVKRWLYKVQQAVAITETEARALSVVLLLFSLGLVARATQRHWAVPEPADPGFLSDTLGSPQLVPYGQDTTRAAPDSLPGPGAPAADSTAAEGPSSGPNRPGPAPLNINEATAAQLDRLPGIGPALARRIIERRDREGPFRTVRDLLSVRGIGAKTLERLAPLVTTGDASGRGGG